MATMDETADRFAIEAAHIADQPRVDHQLIAEMVTAGARVLDDRPENFTLELTGTNQIIDDFIAQVSGHSAILAVVRSGAMAISLGNQILSADY